MSFPSLVLVPGGVLHSQATGVPVNGPNTFAHGVDPLEIDPNWVTINVTPQGPSVLGASFVGYTPDMASVIVNFTQAGTDAAAVQFEDMHSVVR